MERSGLFLLTLIMVGTMMSLPSGVASAQASPATPSTGTPTAGSCCASCATKCGAKKAPVAPVNVAVECNKLTPSGATPGTTLWCTVAVNARLLPGGRGGLTLTDVAKYVRRLKGVNLADFQAKTLDAGRRMVWAVFHGRLDSRTEVFGSKSRRGTWIEQPMAENIVEEWLVKALEGVDGGGLYRRARALPGAKPTVVRPPQRAKRTKRARRKACSGPTCTPPPKCPTGALPTLVGTPPTWSCLCQGNGLHVQPGGTCN